MAADKLMGGEREVGAREEHEHRMPSSVASSLSSELFVRAERGIESAEGHRPDAGFGMHACMFRVLALYTVMSLSPSILALFFPIERRRAILVLDHKMIS